ncbi:hypothetical protein FHG87_007268 [Trinorchestia longiramus]|nr:hypothetical protein FHG87_007268 [Trinorchestia longiramus]
MSINEMPLSSTDEEETEVKISPTFASTSAISPKKLTQKIPSSKLKCLKKSFKLKISCRSIQSTNLWFYCDTFPLLFLLVTFVGTFMSGEVLGASRAPRIYSRLLQVDNLPLNDLSKERQQKQFVKSSNLKVSENNDGVQNIRFSNNNHEINLLFEEFLKQQRKQHLSHQESYLPSHHYSSNEDSERNSHLTLSPLHKNNSAALTGSVTEPFVIELSSNFLGDFDISSPSGSTKLKESISRPTNSVDRDLIQHLPVPVSNIHPEPTGQHQSSVILDLASLSEFFPVYRQLTSALLDSRSLDRAFRAIRVSAANNIYDVADLLLPDGTNRTMINAAIASLNSAVHVLPNPNSSSLTHTHHSYTSLQHHSTTPLNSPHDSSGLTASYQNSSHQNSSHQNSSHQNSSRAKADQVTATEDGRAFSLLNPFGEYKFVKITSVKIMIKITIVKMEIVTMKIVMMEIIKKEIDRMLIAAIKNGILRHGTSVLNQEWAKRLVPIALFYSYSKC